MNNFNIIKGEELSTYVTTGISIGQSKKPNRQGQLSEFAVFTINDADAIAARSRRIIIFNDEKPEVIERLKAYCKTVQVNGENRQIVDMNKLITDLEAEPELIKKRDQLYKMLEFKGGMVTQYKLRKGLCYMNDVNGNPVKDRHGNTIKRDSVTIFVWVKNMTPNEQGGYTTTYYDGYSPWEQGQRMEDRFFEKKVEGTMTQEESLNAALNPTTPTQDATRIAQQRAQAQPQMGKQPQMGQQPQAAVQVAPQAAPQPAQQADDNLPF